MSDALLFRPPHDFLNPDFVDLLSLFPQIFPDFMLSPRVSMMHFDAIHQIFLSGSKQRTDQRHYLCYAIYIDCKLAVVNVMCPLKKAFCSHEEDTSSHTNFTESRSEEDANAHVKVASRSLFT